MPATLRKLSDIWAAIDQQRVDANLKSREWKLSHDGVKAALLHVGLIRVSSDPLAARISGTPGGRASPSHSGLGF